MMTRPLAVHGEELPPVVSVQQQQAEQMKMYWKVSWWHRIIRPCLTPF